MSATLNQIFDEIFVVTIDRNKSRWQLIDEQLKDCNFAYYPGTDAAGCSFEDLKTRYAEVVQIDNNLKQWSVGQIGCWLSHLTLLYKIVEEKIGLSLILEDDFILESNALEENAGVLKHIGSYKFDICYLGYVETCSVNRKYKRPFLRNIFRMYYILKNFKGVPAFDLYKAGLLQKLKCFPKALDSDVDRAGYYYGTHAYAVTLAGAQKILNLFSTIQIPIDRAYAEAVVTGKLTGISLNRQIFFQNQQLISSIIYTDQQGL